MHVQCRDFSSNDTVVLIGGSNDVYKNQTMDMLKVMKKSLASLTHTNVVVVNIPFRHDLLPQSCVNQEIRKANKLIHGLCNHFKNVQVIDTEIISRTYFTQHGLHLNWSGKYEISKKINQKLNKSKLNVIALGFGGNDLPSNEVAN